MAHLVRLNDVWRMLDDCAKGHTKKPSREYWAITFNGKTFRSLPLGPHGRRQNPETETGYVRSLIRHLGISSDCAGRHLDLG